MTLNANVERADRVGRALPYMFKQKSHSHPQFHKSPSGDTSLLFLGNGSICLTYFMLLLGSCYRFGVMLKNVTHLCSRILVGPSHQVIEGHILGHGHVAELERKYLTSGWSIWERHKDDSVEATGTHQSLLDGEKKDRQSVKFN